jgi:hypothetical protein
MKILSLAMWWVIMLTCCFVPATILLVVSASLAQFILHG